MIDNDSKIYKEAILNLEHNAEENNELKEYLKNLTCRGCYSHCSLGNPSCGRSKIFIKDAIEKFNEKILGGNHD